MLEVIAFPFKVIVPRTSDGPMVESLPGKQYMAGSNPAASKICSDLFSITEVEHAIFISWVQAKKFFKKKKKKNWNYTQEA